MMMRIIARSCSRSDRSAAKDFLSVRSSVMGRMQAGAHSSASFARRSFLRAMAQIVDGKVFYRRCGKDSFQVHGNDFFLTRDKE